MNNAFPVAWRMSCTGIRISRPSRPSTTLFRSLYSDNRKLRASRHGYLLSFPNTVSSSLHQHFLPRIPAWHALGHFPHRLFKSSAPSFDLSHASPSSSPPASLPSEDEVSFRHQSLAASEIARIFGSSRISARLGNRTLRVLHSRRLSGTLDLDLPADITKTIP